MHRAIPTIKPVMTVVGAAYILWLAWKTVTSSSHDHGDAGQRSFLAGVLLQFLNPKGILYGNAVASTFLVPYYHSAPTLAGFAAALALLGLASTIFWALFGSIFRRFMAENQRAVSYVMGALLVLLRGVALRVTLSSSPLHRVGSSLQPAAAGPHDSWTRRDAGKVVLDESRASVGGG